VGGILNSLDRIITLQTGLDGFLYVPGTVFAFADERLSGRVYGGRITGYNAGLKLYQLTGAGAPVR
jgi:predicted phage tail protein